MTFASRNTNSTATFSAPEDICAADRLLASISLFSTLTTEERSSLAAQMERKTFSPDEVVVSACRQLARRIVLDEQHASHHTERNIAKRVLSDIRRLFFLA
jgi:hypothetical protein